MVAQTPGGDFDASQDQEARSVAGPSCANPASSDDVPALHVTLRVPLSVQWQSPPGGGACISAEDRGVIYEPAFDLDIGIRAAVHILIATVFSCASTVTP
jgi:hypothetical protein